jgi:hypothetical protein
MRLWAMSVLLLGSRNGRKTYKYDFCQVSSRLIQNEILKTKLSPISCGESTYDGRNVQNDLCSRKSE